MFGKSKKLVMCQACRGLIDSSLRTCPLCGRDSIPDAPARVATRTQNSHFFTMMVLAIMGVIYILTSAVSLNSGASANAIFSGADLPILTDFGAKWLPLIQQGEWWRLVTPIFIHIGILHILFNGFSLYQIGPLVEEAYGSQKFIYIFLITGIMGVVASCVYSPHSPSAGASGAIMGLIGITAVYGHRVGGLAGRNLMRQMVFWTVIVLIYGYAMPGVDNANHIGGLVTGAALGYLIRPEPPTTARTQNIWNVVSIICVVLIAASFAMVGLHYGEGRRTDNIILLDRRIRNLAKVYRSSETWNGPSSGDPKKVADQLRSAQADFESVPHIDQQGDAIKQEFVDLARKRADLFDNADKDPNAPVARTAQDEASLDAAYQQYMQWVNSVKDKYGLEFKKEENPQ